MWRFTWVNSQKINVRKYNVASPVLATTTSKLPTLPYPECILSPSSAQSPMVVSIARHCDILSLVSHTRPPHLPSSTRLDCHVLCLAVITIVYGPSPQLIVMYINFVLSPYNTQLSPFTETKSRGNPRDNEVHIRLIVQHEILKSLNINYYYDVVNQYK
jgi:hypothetical protein